MEEDADMALSSAQAYISIRGEGEGKSKGASIGKTERLVEREREWVCGGQKQLNGEKPFVLVRKGQVAYCPKCDVV
jgi:hypothetical protein